MAEGNYYLGRNGEVNDTLDRVAFKIVDDDGNLVDSYYFATNPSQITASYPARNIFNQTLSDVLMQGYGEGIHTIQIQGQTGFRQWQIMHRGPTGWGTGYQKAKRLKEVLLRQINNAHDDGRPAHMTSLYFMNYTDEVGYKVEPDQQGIQFQQSNQDPLSYYYTIELVVIAPADEPNPDEYDNDHIGNSMSTMAETVPGATIIPSGNPGMKIDRGYLYRHPSDENDDNESRMRKLVDNYQHGYQSIVDWGNWTGKGSTLEDKQQSLNGYPNVSNHKSAVLMDIINQYAGQSPLVHVVYNDHRPLDILLDNSGLNNTNLEYWDKWFNKTDQTGNNQIGVSNDDPTGYDEQAGEVVRTQPNGDKLIYANSADLSPEAVVTNKGTLYYLNGQNSASQDDTDNQHIVIDGAGHVLNAPQGHNIQYIINYDLACTSHVVQIAPGNPGNHYIDEPILWQNIHHNSSSAIFTWGQPSSIPVNYDALYRHTGSKGEWTCTTQVAGNGTIYWDGQGHITNEPNGSNDSSSQSSLIIDNYTVANSDQEPTVSSLNISDLQLPDTVMNNAHPGNQTGNSMDVTQYHIPDSSTNYIVSDGLINTYYIDSIFDIDVSAYYAKNASNYKVNGSTQTPPFIASGQVSSDTNNNFNYDFQSAIDDNMTINFGGQNVSLQNYFNGEAAPEDEPNTTSYWQDKGSNYLRDGNNHINPALYAYICYWIQKNLAPSVVNPNMEKQAQLSQNTDYMASQQAVDESGQVKNGWLYPYNESMAPSNLSKNATNTVYGYYDRDGNIVYDESKSHAHNFLIPVDYDTTFTPQHGYMVINNPGTPGPTDTKEDEAVNNNDIKYANDIGHATMYDNHLVYDPYGKIVIPTNGTMLMGIKLDGHYVKEVVQVSSNTTKTGIPVPSHEYGTNYLRAFYDNGTFIANPEGNVIVPSNGTEIETDSNGNQIITFTGSNTTPVQDNNYYKATSRFGSLYLDPNGKITVPTMGTRIENINGLQRIVATDGTNDWVVCSNNLQQELVPSQAGTIYIPRSEATETKDGAGHAIITEGNGVNPVNPSNYIGNADDIERAAIDPMGNVYLNNHGSIYVPKNGTTTVGAVINGVDEQIVKDVGSNTTATGQAIPDSEIPNAENTERASLENGNLILDKNGSILVTKNGTMVQKNNQGQLVIVDTGSNTTPQSNIPNSPTVDTDNTNFQYIKNANGYWVLVPKNGVEIVNRGGKNFVINTGSNTTDPGPDIPNNLSNNAITASQSVVDKNGKITIMPTGFSTNGDVPNEAMFNVKQYATDLTTITDKNGKLVVEPNQYSTTDEGQPIPTDLTKNSTNWIQVRLKNGQVQVQPASAPSNTGVTFDYGSPSGYVVADVHGKIQYQPIDTHSDNTPDNLAKNSTNWVQVRASNGKLVIEPASPGIAKGFQYNKAVGQNTAQSSNSFVGGQSGSHTELQDNKITVVSDTNSSLNTIISGTDSVNTLVIDDNNDNPEDNKQPFMVNGNTELDNPTTNASQQSNNPNIIQGNSSKQTIYPDK